jgi:hypothetical protein
VFSTAQQAQFEKRNTFCDATVVGAAGESSEPDHFLEWMSAREAETLLVPVSHRWAISEWRGTSAREDAL